MPCRQMYQVNNQEQGKAAQRDQSYRSCLAALFIFFCMCLILILGCIPWKIQNYKESKNENIRNEVQHGEHTRKITTSTTSKFLPRILTTRTTIPTTESIPTEKIIDIFTEDSRKNVDKVSRTFGSTSEHIFERYYTNKITENEKVTIVPERGDKDYITTSKEVLPSTKTEENNATTKKKIDWSTMRFYVETDDVIDNNDVASTSSNKMIASITTLKDKLTTTDVTNRVTTLNFSEDTATEKYFSDKYSAKPEFGVATDNMTTLVLSNRLENATEDLSNEYVKVPFLTDFLFSTVPIQSTDAETNIAKNSISDCERPEIDIRSIDDTLSSTLSNGSATLVENVGGNSTSKYERLEINDDMSSTLSTDFEENTTNSISEYENRSRVVTDNVFSTVPNLSTILNKTSSTEYFSDENYYLETSQSDVTMNNIITSTRSDSEKISDTENSTGKYLNIMRDNYEGSNTTIEYDATTLINDENVTIESTSATENYVLPLNKKSSTITKIINEAEDMINVTENVKDRSETTEKYSENMTSITNEEYVLSTEDDVTATTSVFYVSTTDATTIDMINETILTTTMLANEDTNVCETGHCKQIASKMLSYMNHSADPCEDFYEYACGGYEANSQLKDENLVRRARNYQRIARQMLKEKHENVHSTFATYYDSCVNYERSMSFSERAKMANDMLSKIGKFYTNVTWSDNYVDFTHLLVQLMSHHSALLFDIMPELDEYRPNSFTLKIGPSIYESPFRSEYAEDSCSDDEFETKEHYVNLEILYDNYRRCKNDTREFIRSIKEALMELNVFKGLNNSNLERNVESEYIDRTVRVINSVIMRGYFSQFPPKNEIREAHLMNNYSKITLEELQSDCAFVNWTRLIYSLTGANVLTNESLQIYFHGALVKGLRRLEEFGREDPMSLNNAIMGLYAHKLYSELVMSRRGSVKDHCLQVATHLLRLEASSLYVSSFSDQEITRMNKITENLFNELKRTLKSKIEGAQWARKEGRQGLLDKIDSLKLALPVISYFKNRESLYNEYNISQIILYDNYFNNTMILLRRYRTLMYAELRREVGDLKQIWTYYATPFQSKARAIYGLNLIVIPYGIIDWSLMSDEFSFDYLLLATFGNLIAHQIAHHFDANGIHYWNKTRNIEDSLLYQNEFTNTNFDNYIDCQKENLYQGPMNMTLPYTDQIVSYTIPRLTLNERLSEIMGLRLAYDTLALTRSHAEERLPWTRFRIDQLFYLAYAQMYCTNSPLTSSYVSLYESGDLPSRIRVFVSASNDKLLAEAWKCPLGSQIAPNDVCNVFPYIDVTDKEIVMMPV